MNVTDTTTISTDPFGGMPSPINTTATGMGNSSLLDQIGTLMQGGSTGSLNPQNMNGDLVGNAVPLEQGDEAKALKDMQTEDPTDFQAMETALSHGDGNTATHILAQAVDTGKISKADGAAIGADLQNTANKYGGGVINSSAKNDLSQALGGENVIGPGLTSNQAAAEKLGLVKS